MSDYRTLPAGPALDRLVALEVMGLVYNETQTRWDFPDQGWFSAGDDTPPAYSSEPALAAEVLERSLAGPVRLYLHTDLAPRDGRRVRVSFASDAFAPVAHAEADTFALAVCRAALGYARATRPGQPVVRGDGEEE